MENNHDEGTDDRARALWWQFASAALALVLVFFLLSTVGEPRTPASLQRDQATMDLMTADWNVKTALFLQDIPGSHKRRDSIDLLRQALGKYRAAADAGSPSGARRAGVVGYELEGAKALAAFQKLTASKTLRGCSKKDIADLRSEAAMWGDIYSGSMSPGRVPEYASRIRGLMLGPARGYALYRLYIMADEPKLAQATMSDARRSAAATFIPIVLLIMLLFAAGLAGVVFIIIFAIRQTEPVAGPNEEDVEYARKTSPKHPWVLFQAFTVYIGLMLGLSALASTLLGSTLKGMDSQQRLMDIVLLQFVISAVTGSISLAVLSYLLRANGAKLSDIGLSTKELGRNVLWGMAGFCALLPIYVVAAIASGVIFKGFHTPPHPIVPMLVSGGPGVFALLFVTGAMFAPFFEEIFFRGVLYRGLRARLSFPVSVIVVSTAFALVHPQFPAGFLPIFGVGAVCCVLAETRQSLAPSMVLHALNNGVLFLLMYLLYIA